MWRCNNYGYGICAVIMIWQWKAGVAHPCLKRENEPKNLHLSATYQLISQIMNKRAENYTMITRTSMTPRLGIQIVNVAE